jgi:hypothetical protein
MSDVWVLCSACRKEIPFGKTHWVCSVSTCNRAKMRLIFCSVACWDSHVATLRHRDAWAVEARAPNRAEWMEQQAAATEPAPASTIQSSARKVITAAAPSAPMSTASIPTGTQALSSEVDRDILIVMSKLKKYIKDRSGMNTSDNVAEALSDHVRAICDEAIRAAAMDTRRAVLDRDNPRLPRRG